MAIAAAFAFARFDGIFDLTVGVAELFLSGFAEAFFAEFTDVFLTGFADVFFTEFADLFLIGFTEALCEHRHHGAGTLQSCHIYTWRKTCENHAPHTHGSTQRTTNSFSASNKTMSKA